MLWAMTILWVATRSYGCCILRMVYLTGGVSYGCLTSGVSHGYLTGGVSCAAAEGDAVDQQVAVRAHRRLRGALEEGANPKL